ncbi:MAG TPA: nucleotide sugar dehydrogenase [Candidatus Nanoarchaeia archaeon]|nr:nucleotide sugar dehydrogenase [Candidatus Nanoarchaeia archaeon]
MNTVTIIGLGYVGLPLACLCAEKGKKVYGFDVDEHKTKSVNSGVSPIDDPAISAKLKALKGKITATTNPADCIPNSDVVIVCVPTPIDKNNKPDLTALKSASGTVSSHIKKNTLFVIESTIYPGTIEEIVVPILQEKGLNPFTDEVFVAHCPERIDPGNTKWTIDRLPRVVGGITKKASKKASDFYKSIVDAEIMELTSVKAAEATKIMENTFRDVNIAFVNEMAQSFDKAGIDITEVIKGASTKPFAFMPHYPGAGVGGHCISVDPYYLIEKAKRLGFNHRFLILAREINNHMPHYTVELLENELKKLNKQLSGAKVGVLGLAYKANVDDVRESPAYEVIHLLKSMGAEVFVFDPYVPKESNVKNTNELLEKSDYIILVTNHEEFKNLDLEKLKTNSIKIVIDGRNCLDKEKIKSMGILYHGIGRA